MSPDQHDAVLQKLDEINTKLIETYTKLELLTGNGQPGKIAKIEQDIDDLKAYKNKSTGVIAVFVVLCETAIHKLFK